MKVFVSVTQRADCLHVSNILATGQQLFPQRKKYIDGSVRYQLLSHKLMTVYDRSYFIIT